MPREARRIVTGHDADGKSVVIVDGPPTAAGAFWFTEGAPADNSAVGDAAQLVRKLEPPPGGSIFRYAVIPPEDPSIPASEIEAAMSKAFAQMGAEHCRPDTSRHPGMHKTRTIDYVILLAGELTLLLERGEVQLKPFDVVVQRGTNHAWSNRSSAPAVVANAAHDGAA